MKSSKNQKNPWTLSKEGSFRKKNLGKIDSGTYWNVLSKETWVKPIPKNRLVISGSLLRLFSSLTTPPSWSLFLKTASQFGYLRVEAAADDVGHDAVDLRAALDALLHQRRAALARAHVAARSEQHRRLLIRAHHTLFDLNRNGKKKKQKRNETRSVSGTDRGSLSVRQHSTLRSPRIYGNISHLWRYKWK